MSLLMEALRKAEAAKNKKAGEDDNLPEKLSLEEIETSQPEPATEDKPYDSNDIGVHEGPDRETSAPSTQPPPSLQSLKFELEERDAEESSQTETEFDAADNEDLPDSRGELNEMPSYKGYAENSSLSSMSAPQINEEEILEHMDARSGGADELHGYFPGTDAGEEPAEEHTEVAEQTRYETLEAAAELREYERSKLQRAQAQEHPDQARLDRQTAHSLFQAKKQLNKPSRSMLALLAVLVALLPIGGGVYWYYTNNLAGSGLFPATAVITSPQGFIDEAAPVEAAAQPAIPPPTPELAETLPPTAEAPEAPMESVGDPAPPVIAQQTPPAVQPETVQPEAAPVPAAQESAIQFTRTTQQPQINPDLLAAYESFQQNDLAQAQRLYTQVLTAQPNSRDALLGLAIINRQQGEISQARAFYSRLLQLNPRDPLARAGLLESTQDGSPVQQEGELRALIEAYPDVAPLPFALGNLFASQSRWNEAQNAYFDALLLASENVDGFISPDYAFNLAVSLERLNQLQLAYTYYLQARELSTSAPAGFSTQSLNQRLDYLQRILE